MKRGKILAEDPKVRFVIEVDSANDRIRSPYLRLALRDLLEVDRRRREVAIGKARGHGAGL